ncbi:hypothetical protein E4P24_00370 [Haloferax sp. AS1]|jgi:hypothetical protein|nr:hypothetical protein [Haloferax sp. AS1]
MEVSPNRTHLSTTSDTSHVVDKTTEKNVGDGGQSDWANSNDEIDRPAFERDVPSDRKAAARRRYAFI